MKREAFSQRLHQELADVRVPQALRQRTLAALNKKETPVMKKKLTLALALVLASLLLGGAALAAVSHWGLLDFVNLYTAHVPENAPDYIQQDVATWETETLTVTVREMYYDGYYLQTVVDMKPHDPATLLIPGMLSTSDCYANLLPELTTEEDSRTIAQFYRDGGYEKLLAISPVLTSENGAGESCFLQEDGTLTFYLEGGYQKPLSVRETELKLLIQTCADPEGNQMDRSQDERVTFPLTLSVPKGVVPVTYVCDTPQDFPEAGVRVDRLTIVALPLSLYATIEYSVIDEEQHMAYMPLEEAIWFEFIAPESPGPLPAFQRLDVGFTSSGSLEVAGDGCFLQRETLGVNELRSEYTLRAFSALTKERYETCTFTLQEVTGDGMASE